MAGDECTTTLGYALTLFSIHPHRPQLQSLCVTLRHSVEGPPRGTSICPETRHALPRNCADKILGGYPKFVQNGYNEHHLALWMQQSGYNTYYGGKLFNGHTTDNYNSPKVSGYTGSSFFLEPFTYQYFNVSVTNNGNPPENFAGRYSTDLLAETTQSFIDDALGVDKPFFITVAPVAPHGRLSEFPPSSGPPDPAPRHRGLLQDYKIPRTKNFNPEEPSSVNWISELERLNDTVVEYNDEYQRHRLRSLLAVDEMVGDIVRRLDDEGVLNNTFIIYTSDNGFHISQHRLHPGKMCGLETDINVPMVVRGPGIPAGNTLGKPSTHTDLAPTIMQLAGNPIDDNKFDGTPIELGIPKEAPSDRKEHVAVEFWGIGLAESHYGNPNGGGSLEYPNNTYKGVRVEAKDYGFYYSVWCINAKELYDMKVRLPHNYSPDQLLTGTQRDPGQLTNLLASPMPDPDYALMGQPLDAVVDRLDALMMVLKSCKERSCVDPWGSLHPKGSVETLADALSPRFDKFYKDQTKFEYEQCAGGYFPGLEGPQAFKVFGGELGKERTRVVHPDWSLWV